MSQNGYNLLFQKVLALTGTDTVYGKGEVIAYCDVPQVCIRQKNGKEFWWRVDMCEFQAPPNNQNQGELESSVDFEGPKPRT